MPALQQLGDVMLRRIGLALVGAIALPTAAQAQISVDGALDATGYAHTAHVGYNSAAPESNFGAPTNESKYVAYDIYLGAQNGSVYGFLKADTSSGGIAGLFSNLYWDLDPANANGSDVGFELSAGTQNFFIPVNSGPTPKASGLADISVFATSDSLEFMIPNHYFTTPLPSLVGSYYPTPMASIGSNVTLRLSQSFGYSVAGGPSYGVDRLGTVKLAAAVPEPATWAMMIAGFGLAGATVRRRRRAVVTA